LVSGFVLESWVMFGGSLNLRLISLAASWFPATKTTGMPAASSFDSCAIQNNPVL